MSYRSCRHGEHGECNGYVGVFDTYVCDCRCHMTTRPVPDLCGDDQRPTAGNGETGDER